MDEIRTGDGVKIFRPPDFGRRDAIVFRVGTNTIIDARLVRGGELIIGIKHRDRIADGDDVSPYWVELPRDYVPGSEGH